MAERQLALPGDLVKISNTLARAPWNPKSVWEARLLATVASVVKKGDKDFKDYEIPVESILGGSVSGDTYTAIDEATDRLMKAGVTLVKSNGRGFKKYNFFSYIEYTAPGKGGQGKLICRFDKAMKPHFLDLSDHFKAWNLMEFLMIPATYSQRLYILLKSWDDVKSGETTIKLDDLHEIFETPPSLRKNFKDFRKRVLEPAKKHLKDTSLHYYWEPIKKGRKVDSIRFIFSKYRKAQVEERKKTEAQTKQSQSKHKLALKAYNCFLKGECVFDEKSKMCEMCEQMKYKEKEPVKVKG